MIKYAFFLITAIAMAETAPIADEEFAPQRPASRFSRDADSPCSTASESTIPGRSNLAPRSSILPMRSRKKMFTG